MLSLGRWDTLQLGELGFLEGDDWYLGEKRGRWVFGKYWMMSGDGKKFWKWISE